MTTPSSPIRGTIQMASHPTAYWTSVNPILLDGQLGIETTVAGTKKLKSGDGVTAWNLLGYVSGTGGGGGASAYTDLTDAATAALPTTNAPLSSALAAKAPTASPTFTGTVSGVTKTHVGLGNVDNTTDATKPVSTAQAAAIALKMDSAGGTFTGPVNGLTPATVGLGLVNNTADLSKPISTATAAALATKQPTLIAGSGITIDGTNTINASVGGAAINVPFSAVIPLDTPGNGKFMTAFTQGANIVLSVGAGAVEQGNCNFAIVGDSVHSLDVTAFIPAGETTISNGYVFNNAKTNIYSAVYTYGTPALIGFVGAAVTSLPGQVTALAAGTSTATTQPLTWSAPGSGGTPTDYLVEFKASSSGTWLTFADGVSTSLSATVTGLTLGTSYDYRVSATNAAGTGTASSTVTHSTLAVPGQVTAVTAGTATTTTQPLTWTAPSTGGTPADYLVEFKTHAGSTWVTFPDGVSTATSATVTGLTSGVSYDYRVTATNGAGSGTASTTLTASTSSGGGKITFSDDFTGTDGSAPNARWTGVAPGWQITGNRLFNLGSVYNELYATCTAGDNTVSVDVDWSGAGSSYGAIFIRYIDANNYTVVQARGDNGEKLRIYETVGGVVGSPIADDTAARLGGAANLSVSLVGSTCTVTVTGGPAPGSFSGTLTSANNTATKIALGMNVGTGGNPGSVDYFDNCVLA